MTPTPEVEAVARAIFSARRQSFIDEGIGEPPAAFEDMPDFGQAFDRALATAAIAALDKARGDGWLPCDVKVPPATTIKAGVSISTLMSALSLSGRPRTFPAPPASDGGEAL